MRTLLSTVIFIFLLPLLIHADDKSEANSQLLAACMSPKGEDDVDAIRAALKLGADINVQDEQSGQTCLMAAVLRDKINIVRLLFKLGADHTIGERQGYTPVHGAAFQGRPDVMHFLNQVGLDVNHVHEDGFSPIHRACWGSEPKHTDTFKALVKMGTDPLLQSKDGKTCLDMTNNKDIIEFIELVTRPEL